jgi:ATP-binding cassette subfamily B protein
VKPPVPEDPFRLRRIDLAKVVVIALCEATALVIFLLLLRAVVDGMSLSSARPWTQGTGPRSMVDLLGALLVAALVYGWVRGIEFSVTEKIGYDVVRRVRMDMYRHLQGMAPRHIQGRSRGGLLLRFVGDLSMLRMWISRGLLGGLVALIVLGVATGVLVALNAWLALSVLAVLAAGAAVSLVSGKAMRSATRTMRRRRSLLMSNIDEQINALPVVQVFGRSGGEYSRLSAQNDSLNRSLFRVAGLRGRLRGIASTVGLLLVVVVLAVGIVQIARGGATLGLVIATVTVARQLNGPVRTLGLAHDYWHRGRVSRQKVLDFLRSSGTDPDASAQARLRVRKGAVEFRDVSVPGALTHVDVTAQPGQLVAVTGPTGAGKSTLLWLVTRLAEPATGEVVVDGQPLSTTTAQSTYRNVGTVSPDLPLMRGTVRRNIVYRDPSASEEEVRRVVLATGLDEVLAGLRGGPTAWLTEGGRNISAGQRQRIALARAMLGNPPILALDEPTANLDPDGSALVRDVIARYGGTILLVTHEPAEMALADQVWVMERGRITHVLSGDEYRDRWWDGTARHLTTRTPWSLTG